MKKTLQEMENNQRMIALQVQREERENASIFERT